MALRARRTSEHPPVTARPGGSSRRPGSALGLTLAVLLLGPLVGLDATAHAQDVFQFDGTRAYPVGSNAKGFSAGDCNNDGIVDIIAAGQNAGAVVTLLNDGEGIFEFDAMTNVGSQPTGAACGDFNGDGLIDIAAVSRDQGTVGIYHRQETGGFTLAGTRPAGLLPTSLTAGHLNADTHLDLVAVGSRSNDITILLGTGTGTLPPFSGIRVPMDDPHAAAIADFNLDGKPDIAVAGGTDPFVVLLMGDGSSFAPLPETVPHPFHDTRRPPKAVGIAAADINLDGSPDLAVLSLDGAVHLYLGDGTGHFTFLNSFGGPDGAEAVLLDDFDFDGLIDLALLYSSTNSVQVFFATAPAQFPDLLAAPSNQPALNGFGMVDARTVQLDPLDVDSMQLQLVALDNTPPGMAVVQQDDLDDLSVTPVAGLSDTPLGILLADVTNDGTPDAIVNHKVRGRSFPLRLMRGTAAGGYEALLPSGPSTCGDGILEGAELCDDGNPKGRDGCSKTCVPEIKGPVTSIGAADMNGDQINDLVVVDKGGVIALLLSDGQGRFEDVRILGKAKRKTGAVVGDFTSDGIPDIVVMPRSRRSGALLLLVNDGTGEFVPVSMPSARRLKGPLLSGDFDANGFPDVLVGEKSSFALFLNDGAGPARDGGSTAMPRGRLLGFAAADFDEDGWLDVLASFKESRRTPPALLFRGSPTTQFGAGATLGITGSLANPYVVDVDQDLHQDIVSCDPGRSTLCTPYYGNGEGVFGAAALPDDTSVGRDVRGAGAADFDGDGHVDLVGISRRDNRGKVMFRHPQRSEREQTVLVTGMKPAAMALVDLDGNGMTDIVVANEGSNDLSVFMSFGARNYPTPAPVRLPVGGLGAPAIGVGDLNHDGRPDLAVTQAGSDTVTPFLNLGGALAALGPITVGDEPRGVAIGKLNADTALDIVTANRGADTISVLLSQPDGSYLRTDYPSGGQRPSAVTLTDLDHNGFDDVIVTNEKIVSNLRTGNVVTFLNDGTAVFTTPSLTHVRGRETPRAICHGDFDDDGEQDVAVASVDSNDVMVLLGDGTGGWRPDERDFPVGQEASAVWCLDADGDGRTDLAYGRKRAGDVGAILTGDE